MREIQVIWHNADDHGKFALARAVGRLNDRLAIAPYTEGESRPPGDLRIGFELPLRIYYRIERFQGAVVVLHAWLVTKRSQK